MLSHLLSEHECAVVFQGPKKRLLVRGPGSVRSFGRWKRVVIVDLRPFVLDVALTGLLTGDGVPVSVSGSLDGQVLDPDAAVAKVVDYKKATMIMAETVIRSALMECNLGDRESAVTRLDAAVIATAAPNALDWGVAIWSAQPGH